MLQIHSRAGVLPADMVGFDKVRGGNRASVTYSNGPVGYGIFERSPDTGYDSIVSKHSME